MSVGIPSLNNLAPKVASGSPARSRRPAAPASPFSRPRASAAASQRPFLVIPIGVTSNFSRSIAARTDAAESSETSCSPLRPPKRMPTRSFFAISPSNRPFSLLKTARNQCRASRRIRFATRSTNTVTNVAPDWSATLSHARTRTIKPPSKPLNSAVSPAETIPGEQRGNNFVKQPESKRLHTESVIPNRFTLSNIGPRHFTQNATARATPLPIRRDRMIHTAARTRQKGL